MLHGARQVDSFKFQVPCVLNSQDPSKAGFACTSEPLMLAQQIESQAH